MESVLMVASPGPETRLVNKITKKLRAMGAFVINNHGGTFSRAGVPDLTVIIGGHTVWMEVKTESGRVAPIQKNVHDKMRRRGANIHVIRSVGEAVDAVERL